MKCLRCGPLIKAIDAYLAKAENDLYEQLTMEGYLKAKESLNTVDEMQASDKYIPLRWAIPAGCSPLP